MRSYKNILLTAFVLFSTALTSESLAQAFENERIYQAYLKIQDSAVAGEFEEALTGINKLAAYKVTDVEKAAILRARGFILLNLDRETDAITDFNTALNFNILNLMMQQEMRYILANLYASQENWTAGYEIYKNWLTIAEGPQAEKEGLPAPDADAYTLGAALASNNNDFPFAIELTNRALNLSDNPARELFNLLIALHFQNSDLPNAIAALQRGLAHYPNDEEFWKNLSGIYQLLKDDKEALAALIISYDEGLMDSAEEYLLLGRFYMFNEVPFNAAEVITKGMEAGLVERNLENLELLSQAWYSAREYDKSLDVLKEIVRTTGNEEATLRASQILIDQEAFDKAIELLNLAAANSDLDEPGMLYKLKGYAYYGLKQYLKAIESFNQSAQADPEMKEASDQWVDYINTEFVAQAN